MAECGDGDSTQWEGRTGTHETLWGPGSKHEEAAGAHGRLGAWQQLWEACNLPAPMSKKLNTPAVCEEDLKVDMGKCGDGDSYNGRRTGTL
ncbi:unnamed protein product [Staurois parvus]|uniref:Uncharacterized protein n=1 Tax=Staurois parvus TaxID=386267 RepID=A0ABN9EJ61_9NEOB|nr:unnamed protein product [Staurois parvus]